MEELRLDGNAAAGVLRQVFAVEMTTAMGTCAGCGAADAVGAALLYRGAGLVLRCPTCDNALARIVEGPDRVWLDMSGLRSVEVRL